MGLALKHLKLSVQLSAVSVVDPAHENGFLQRFAEALQQLVQPTPPPIIRYVVRDQKRSKPGTFCTQGGGLVHVG